MSPMFAVARRDFHAIKQKNTQVLLGDVRHVDEAAKRVMLADGGVFPYDHLIAAAGSQTWYYGHDNWH